MHRVETADRYGLPVSEVSSWGPDDRAAVHGLAVHRGECCSDCGTHPSVWDRKQGGHPNALVPVWKFCRVCELIGASQTSPPPHVLDPDKKVKPGWRMVLQHQDHEHDE